MLVRVNFEQLTFYLFLGCSSYLKHTYWVGLWGKLLVHRLELFEVQQNKAISFPNLKMISGCRIMVWGQREGLWKGTRGRSENWLEELVVMNLHLVLDKMWGTEVEKKLWGSTWLKSAVCIGNRALLCVGGEWSFCSLKTEPALPASARCCCFYQPHHGCDLCRGRLFHHVILHSIC